MTIQFASELHQGVVGSIPTVMILWCLFLSIIGFCYSLRELSLHRRLYGQIVSPDDSQSSGGRDGHGGQAGEDWEQSISSHMDELGAEDRIRFIQF